jgi:hypothetical protein
MNHILLRLLLLFHTFTNNNNNNNILVQTYLHNILMYIYNYI